MLYLKLWEKIMIPNRPFVGRKQELEALSGLLQKQSASLVVVQGRRRIGKSRLIEEFAKEMTFFQFSGLPPIEDTTRQSQFNEFARQLSLQIGGPEIKSDDWTSLFFILYQQVKIGRAIILFDEISWMGSKDPDFLGKLKNAWDLYFKKNPELILVLCGSVSSWIDKNILSSTGFVGRISYRLRLGELPLSDCKSFWPNNTYISTYEKLKILSVTGGVPRYLEEIKPAQSAADNIRNLCFIAGGLLVNEFKDIFSDLFSNRTSTYKKIVKTLAQGSKEIKEICEALEITQTGAISSYLDDLIKSGFVKRDYTWDIKSGKPSRLSHFRLSDNYLRFYLKYIEPLLDKIEDNEFDFTCLSALPGWDTIMALQFENLVLGNRQYIKDVLGLTHGQIISNNPFFQRATRGQPGCQIDYLIQTKHNNLYVCEFKFSKHPIGIDVIKEVQQKIERLVYPKGFSVMPVLVHASGVTNEVIYSGFFAKIIDFGELLSD
jgi:AAA+ ATPase superfamily predicted ATPase